MFEFFSQRYEVAIPDGGHDQSYLLHLESCYLNNAVLWSKTGDWSSN